MRIGALFDIYGNLPGLEAVLADVRAAGVDRIIVGGDIVVGPMTREALAYLRALDLPVEFLYGNCEVAVLDQLGGRTPKGPWLSPKYRPILEWTADQHRDDRDVLASWPLTGGSTCRAGPCCSATRRRGTRTRDSSRRWQKKSSRLSA